MYARMCRLSASPSMSRPSRPPDYLMMHAQNAPHRAVGQFAPGIQPLQFEDPVRRCPYFRPFL